MKYAFLIMGNYDPQTDHTAIPDKDVEIIGVADITQARDAARRLCADGVGCIELCGAFGPEGAREIIQATENKIPVGYVTHVPEQDELFVKAFGK